MASYIGQTALTALWNKLVAILSSKADRASVYSKAEVDYKLATTYGTGSGSGGGGDTSDCVHLTGTETISGNKTFSGSNSFSGNLTITSGTNTQYSGTMTYASSVLKIRSTSTAYSATIANTASRSITINLPTASGTHTLVSKTTSTTANQLTIWSDTTGVLKNSGYTINTSITSSSSGIPTSAAVRSYVSSNSSSGGSEWYNIIPAKQDHQGTAIIGAILEGFRDLNLTSSGGYYYYLMRMHRSGGRRRWAVPYYGYVTEAADAWPLNKCRWNISTTSSFTQFWGGTYLPTTLFTQRTVNGYKRYNGGGYNHTFGCAIFKESGTYGTGSSASQHASGWTVRYIKRVSNIAMFTMGYDHVVRLWARRG